MAASRRVHAIEKEQGEQSKSDDTESHTPPTVAEGQRSHLSLLGEEGKTVARNMARIALGDLSPEDLDDDRYYVADDGVPGIRIDEATAQELSRSAMQTK